MKIFALSVNLFKNESTGTGMRETLRPVLGFRMGVSQEEAIGFFVRDMLQKYPDFTLGDVIVSEVPKNP